MSAVPDILVVVTEDTWNSGDLPVLRALAISTTSGI
jgi:hypothetical protein